MADYNKPLPEVNEDNKEFWTGCKSHELRFQKCKSCGHIRWPASIICPICHSRDLQWIVASGKGKIYTFAVYHVAYHRGFENDLPYTVADIELEEGPHILSNIVGCSHHKVRCDMPVVLSWEDITEEFSLPKFRPLS